jgi:hypothetical protein
MQQFGGKDSKRHFTVVMGGKEHGLYVSSTPFSAAKKAVTKLCAANKIKKVQFEIREITQGSKKKTYGPYSGHIEKLKEPIELMGRVIKYKPVAKLLKKKSEMKGGVSEFNKNRNSVTGLTVNAIEKMFKNFKVENQQEPAYFHYKIRRNPTNTLYFGRTHLLDINSQKYYPFSIHFINDDAYIRYLMSIAEYNKNKYADFISKDDYKLYTNDSFKDYRIIEFNKKEIYKVIDYHSERYNYFSQATNIKDIGFLPGFYVPWILFKDFLKKFVDSLNNLSQYKISDSITQLQVEINEKFTQLNNSFLNLQMKIIILKKKPTQILPNVPENLLKPNIKLPNINLENFSNN